MALATPKLLIDLVIWRLVPMVMLLLKIPVVLLHLALLFLSERVGLGASGNALVGHLGLGRRVGGACFKWFAAARSTPGVPVCETVHETGVVVLLLSEDAGLV